jgi:hypothetical protein
MAKQNTDDVRIFVFGEGFDVNTKLLDFLALNHRGEADYILPKKTSTEKIGRFFDRVGSPIMTDLQVTFDGLEVKDVYPQKDSRRLPRRAGDSLRPLHRPRRQDDQVTGTVGRAADVRVQADVPRIPKTTRAASSPGCGPARRSITC